MNVADIPEFLGGFTVQLVVAFLYIGGAVALFRIYRAVTEIPARLERIETLLSQQSAKSGH